MSEINVSEKRNILDENSMTFEERKKQLEKQAKREKAEAEKEKKSDFKNFYQINNKYSDNLIIMSLNQPKARAILDFLLSRMDGLNALCCSYVAIQEALGISRTTVYDAIKYLTENDFINVAKTGNSTVFFVNSELAWKSWGKNKQYCEFTAKILISSSENPELAAGLKKCKSTKTVVTPSSIKKMNEE